MDHSHLTPFHKEIATAYSKYLHSGQLTVEKCIETHFNPKTAPVKQPELKQIPLASNTHVEALHEPKYASTKGETVVVESALSSPLLSALLTQAEKLSAQVETLTAKVSAESERVDDLERVIAALPRADDLTRLMGLLDGLAPTTSRVGELRGLRGEIEALLTRCVTVADRPRFAAEG